MLLTLFFPVSCTTYYCPPRPLLYCSSILKYVRGRKRRRGLFLGRRFQVVGGVFQAVSGTAFWHSQHVFPCCYHSCLYRHPYVNVCICLFIAPQSLPLGTRLSPTNSLSSNAMKCPFFHHIHNTINSITLCSAEYAHVCALYEWCGGTPGKIVLSGTGTGAMTDETFVDVTHYLKK